MIYSIKIPKGNAHIRTLLILLKTMNVSAKEFFSDPRFESEEPDIDFK